LDWNTRNYWDESYFKDVTHSLESGSFINHEINYNPLFQVGVWIVERVDLVVNEFGFDEGEPSLVKSAIAALKSAFTTHPEFVAQHIQYSIGTLTYPGILNANQSDVRDFWLWLNKVVSDDPWIKRLAIHVLSDDDFYVKVEEVQLYSERGLDDYEIFKKIEQDSRSLNRTIVSAESLVELGIVLNQPIA